HSRCFVVITRPGTGLIGFGTSKGIGTHVKRNRQRRRAQAALRQCSAPTNIDLIVMVKQNAINADLPTMVKELSFLLR
ncbi:ribonuclease P protein component, partial [Klebsiella pneumoniae]|uniref:ribonuclease P protein component n=1 Tax=Klebsiella pneumoniae TaxID=573 RepID=UPI00385279DC